MTRSKIQRRIDGALSMANDSNIGDKERSVWLDKAKELAAKYEVNLNSVFNEWDKEEKLSSFTDVVVGDSEVFIHKEDVGWAEQFTSILAKAFDTKVVKHHATRDDEEYIGEGKDFRDFYSYSFIGHESHSDLATLAAFNALEVGYGLVEDAVITESQLHIFMVEFAQQVLQRIERSKKFSREVALYADRAIDDYINEKWNNQAIERTVKSSSLVSNESDPEVKAEAYIMAQKIKVS